MASPAANRRFRDEYRAFSRSGWQSATVTNLSDAIDAALRLIGIDHVGISSDFNPGGGVVRFRSVVDAPNATRKLMKRPYGDTDIAKLCGGNYVPVPRRVEALAAPKGPAKNPCAPAPRAALAPDGPPLDPCARRRENGPERTPLRRGALPAPDERLTMTLTREELRRRSKAFDRERHWVSVLGYLPLLLVYALVHTTYLRPYLSTDKSVEVLELLGLPFTWLAIVTLLHRRFGPARHGLVCETCGARLTGPTFKTALETGHCARCEAVIVADATASAG